ncbi:KUP/HAK/KT family potassium transporter [Candidatus Magnetaquicoccus inordinatus]|uniref:KUP/HAK/KT family potassium transporter n=1 Tax=Candidatus Magnetaquicoccus inordinatus TaxID=2496818 RepID=UPI003B9678B8
MFMSSNRHAAPPAMVHMLQHTMTLHERVILLSVRTEESPYVTAAERMEVENIFAEFYRVTPTGKPPAMPVD